MNNKTSHEQQNVKSLEIIKKSDSQNHTSRSSEKILDLVKVCIAVIIVAAGLWSYYSLINLPVYLRVLLPLICIVIGLSIVLFWCDFGRRLIWYIRDSFIELKKVVWPDRQSTLRMTIFVIIFVAILASFIYAVDSFISWLFFDVLLKRG